MKEALVLGREQRLRQRQFAVIEVVFGNYGNGKTSTVREILFLVRCGAWVPFQLGKNLPCSVKVIVKVTSRLDF